jgi:hypothetical protein
MKTSKKYRLKRRDCLDDIREHTNGELYIYEFGTDDKLHWFRFDKFVKGKVGARKMAKGENIRRTSLGKKVSVAKARKHYNIPPKRKTRAKSVRKSEAKAMAKARKSKTRSKAKRSRKKSRRRSRSKAKIKAKAKTRAKAKARRHTV